MYKEILTTTERPHHLVSRQVDFESREVMKKWGETGWDVLRRTAQIATIIGAPYSWESYTI